MSQSFTSSTDHLDSSALPASAAPLSMGIWVNTAATSGKNIFGLVKSGDTSVKFMVGTDAGGTGKLSFHVTSTSVGSEALSSSAITNNVWQNLLGVAYSSSSIAAFVGGKNKGTASGSVTPSGLTGVTISGRVTDHNFGLPSGLAAHAVAWARALSDLEAACYGGGMDPRFIKGLVSYWKLVAAGGSGSTEPDVVGTNTLTNGTTVTPGGSNPNVSTYFTGPNIGNQSFTVGTPITSIDFGAPFDNVSAPFTVQLRQLGASVSMGTMGTTQATGIREIVISPTGWTVGDYFSILSSGTQTLVIAVGTTSILVRDDQTWTSGQGYFRWPSSALTIGGLTMSGNVLSGSPTTANSLTGCFGRASNNNNSALIADTDLHQYTIASSGGGASLLMPAGVYTGGYVGG